MALRISGKISISARLCVRTVSEKLNAATGKYSMPRLPAMSRSSRKARVSAPIARCIWLPASPFRPKAAPRKFTPSFSNHNGGSHRKRPRRAYKRKLKDRSATQREGCRRRADPLQPRPAPSTRPRRRRPNMNSSPWSLPNWKTLLGVFGFGRGAGSGHERRARSRLPSCDHRPRERHLPPAR